MDMCMCFDGSCTLAAWHGERMGRVDWGCEGDGHAEMTGLCGEGAGTQCRWMEKGGAAGSSETESTYTPQRLATPTIQHPQPARTYSPLDSRMNGRFSSFKLNVNRKI